MSVLPFLVFQNSQKSACSDFSVGDSAASWLVRNCVCGADELRRVLHNVEERKHIVKSAMRWVASHVQISHITCKWVMSHMYESCHRSRGTIHESCHVSSGGYFAMSKSESTTSYQRWDEVCLAYECRTFILAQRWGMSHVWISRHIWLCDTRDLWIGHVMCKGAMSHTKESCHMQRRHVAYKGATSHTKESCHVRIGRVTHESWCINESWFIS